MRNHLSFPSSLVRLPLALASVLLLLGGCEPADQAGDTDGATQDTTATAAAAPPPSPAAGYDVHVTAPHVVNGEVMGPFHHYCKAISPEPIIQCILFDTTEPDAPMTEVEYIVAKSVTRNEISREEWNRAWHDHALEIASGRVEIHDMSEEDAAALAELVATTDGLIFHLWPAGADIPTGEVSIAQAVSHEALDAAEWEAQRAAATAATEAADAPAEPMADDAGEEDGTQGEEETMEEVEPTDEQM
ncbi:MAG TPA: DUF1264 domain-containing protein [Gemmatimonadota bacterium]|nr:DUF1264 domain-containing protein [Gemmatimonadota bacterium]